MRGCFAWITLYKKKKVRIAFLGFVLIGLSFNHIRAQSNLFPLNNDLAKIILQNSVDTQFNFHSNIRPYQVNDLEKFDTLYSDLNVGSKGIAQYLLDKPLLSKEADYKFKLSPIIYALFGKGKSLASYGEYEGDGNRWLGVGVQLESSWKNKLAVGFEYTYSEITFLQYVDDYADNRKIIPGFGEFQQTDLNYYNHYYTGYLNYTPSKILTLEVGRGKHFYGHGYRSLLLSDNSTAYPYGKINLNIWKLKYQVLYANYKHFIELNDGSLVKQNKYSTSNYLSANIGKHANISLFQSVIWQATDSLHDRGFDVNYLNPFIFMRPVEFSIGSPDNMLLGLDFSYTIFKNYKFYAQVILDEFLLDEIKAGNGWWGNKYGYQLGLSLNDFFKLKGIQLQLEYNEVRPYTYAHTNVVQNYGNSNSELAHPYGANFKEAIIRLSYVKKRWLFLIHTVFAQQGFSDGQTNYGENIFVSNTQRQEYGNYTTQGNKSNLSYQQVKISYLINPQWKLMMEIGLTNRQRSFDRGTSQENRMIHIGLKTALYNQYLDF